MAPWGASQREASHWVQESWININTFSNCENTFPVSIKHISTAVSWEWRRKSRNFRNSNFSFRQNEIHRNSFSFNSLFQFLRNETFGDQKIKAQNRGNIAGETQHHHSPITLEFLQPKKIPEKILLGTLTVMTEDKANHIQKSNRCREVIQIPRGSRGPNIAARPPAGQWRYRSRSTRLSKIKTS